MISIEVKDNEPIERALKRFKKKIERVKLTKEVKRRLHFVKDSVKRKEEKQKAIYRQQLQQKALG